MPCPAWKPGRAFFSPACWRFCSTQDIHTQARGEASEATTRVRAVEILIRPVQLAPNGEVTFLASRNGLTIASQNWSGSADSMYIVPAVLFDDNVNGELLMMTKVRRRRG